LFPVDICDVFDRPDVLHRFPDQTILGLGTLKVVAANFLFVFNIPADIIIFFLSKNLKNQLLMEKLSSLARIKIANMT
jgi:hypothetical protein